MRLFSKIFRVVFIAGLLLGAYSAIGVPLYAQRTDNVTADAAIVLGAAAYGNRPSPIFRERINHAIQLYQDNQVDTLIFTGGVGNRSSNSEAAVARSYAIQRGIPASAILIEESSTSTIENLTNAFALVEGTEIDTFLIVSTPIHQKRAMLIAERLGRDAYTSPTQTTYWRGTGLRQQLYIREVIGYAHHFLLFW